MEKTEYREGIEQLRLPLVHKVFAVGIQDDAVTLQHIHHLEQMVRRVLEQRSVAEQATNQFLLIR